MFNNIGKKIKILAKILLIVELAIVEIIGLDWLTFDDEQFVAIGLLMMFVAPVVLWISSWFMYGFGELIDKTCDIARNTRQGEIKSEAQVKVDNERISKLENLRAQGLITEEEFQQAIQK